MTSENEGNEITFGRSPPCEGETSFKLPEKKIAPTCKRNKILWPPKCTGMITLDKPAFTKLIKIPTIILSEQYVNPIVIKKIVPFLLKVAGIKSIIDISSEENDEKDGSAKMKKIYLNPELFDNLTIPEFISEKLQLDRGSVINYFYDDVKFKYENWTLQQLIDSVIPDGEEKVASFSQMGHLVHVNLKEHIFPYKYVVGQIILDKVNGAKTVVNKINNIESKFRNFQMEVIAGESKTVVTVKENRCQFEFDFAKVYWNARLSYEHDRLSKLLQAGDTLYDVFGGVGPFALPAAKRKAEVLANDLNPDCYTWLLHNVKKNKVDKLVQCFNQDGNDFIKNVISEDLKQKLEKSKNGDYIFENRNLHVFMNLPAIAVDFLKSFWGILNEVDPNLKLLVHVHCFIKDISGYKEKAVTLVKDKLNYDLPQESITEVKFVRNVAPNKEMLCVSFAMPHHVLTSPYESENPLKRKHSETD